jgi:hypothetical protein
VSLPPVPRQLLLIAGVLGCLAAAFAAGIVADRLACRLCPGDADLEFGVLAL